MKSCAQALDCPCYLYLSLNKTEWPAHGGFEAIIVVWLTTTTMIQRVTLGYAMRVASQRFDMNLEFGFKLMFRCESFNYVAVETTAYQAAFTL